MKIMRLGERLGYIGKDADDKRRMISLGEAYGLWTALVLRYDSLIETKILLDHTSDRDLQVIINRGIDTLESQRVLLENLLKEFGIPMPGRPPESSNTVVDANTLTDQLIFRKIYNGMGDAMFKHITNFQRSNSSYIREVFRKIMNQEMDLYDEFYEYGKLKTYLHEPPTFRA